VLGGEGAMDGVEAVRIRNVKSDATTDIAAEGCFVAIGHTPSTEVFQGQLELDDEGYLVAASPGTARSSVEGVFVAGDCVDKIYRQAVTAAGMGCMAALEAEKYLAEQEDAAQAAE
ncbi:MAG: FAD-dependent oxidoreductase, partial [Rhodospirillaceae bacterium]|nr:FAD-dependent oxidoreductase [Rhodospirillaceae bacterium]